MGAVAQCDCARPPGRGSCVMPEAAAFDAYSIMIRYAYVPHHMLANFLGCVLFNTTVFLFNFAC